MADIATTAIAAAALGLSIFNTWKAQQREKPKLIVRAKVRIGDGIATAELAAKMKLSNWDALCIEVVNTGSIAVTVDEVGFLRKGSRDRYVGTLPGSPNEGKLPVRIEPRTDFQIYMRGTGFPEKEKFKCAYAKTACDRTFKGKAREVKILRKLLALPKKSAP
jgi:hypothetical protein